MKKKNALTMAVLAAVASIGFVMNASAEEIMSHQMETVVVEGSRAALPGGFIAAENRVGVLGNVAAVDVPFSQQTYTEKTIEKFTDPAQGMNGILANNPSIRIGSPSPQYTDINMRGLNMSAGNYYINGVPNMFGQSRSIPAYVLESVEVVAGPNQVLNGSMFSNNGFTADQGPAGLVLGKTKKATDADINRYTQTFTGRSENIENLDLGRRFGKSKEWGVRVNLRNDYGGMAVKGAKINDKSIYVNLDHRSKKSTTNLFGGYYDFRLDGGQRWINASNVNKGKLAAAPDGSTNLSFKEQFKANHGYLFVLNHDQKFSDKWGAFVNAGYQHYNEDKFDPNAGSWYLYDDGSLTPPATGSNNRFRNYQCNSQGYYGQVGIRNTAETANLKNNLTLSFDYFNYRNTFQRVTGKQKLLDSSTIWSNGLVMDAPVYAETSLVGLYPTKDSAWSATLADRVEVGKWNAFVALNYRDSKYATKVDNEVSKASLNPSYSVAYKPTKNSSIYASHSESYTKPYIVSGHANDGEVFKPLKLKQNEVGVKCQTGAMLHGLAVFELQQALNLTDNNDYVNQDGKNKYRGIEYTFTGKASDKWNLMGGLLYLNGKRDKTQDGTKDGWYACGAPKWNGVLAAEYEATKDTSLIGRVNFTGKSHVNDNGTMAPGFTTMDLGVQHNLKFNGFNVKLNAMCYNVLGKDYWISRGNSVALGNPRTFMVSAQMNF